MSKLKSVNGVKILKRHSSASIFTGLFSLIIVGGIVALFFIPYLSIKDVKVTGFDLILHLFGQELTDFMPIVDELATEITASYLVVIVQIGFTVAGIVLIVSALLGLILLFAGLEHMFKGYSHHLSHPRFLSWLISLVCLLPIGALPLTVQILTMLLGAKIEGFDNSICLGIWPIVIFGGALVCAIIITTVYGLGYKGRIFVGDVHEMNNAEKEETNNASKEENQTETPLESKPVITVNDKVETTVPTAAKRNLVLPRIVDLPKNIRNIGGHAFAENLQLTVANIPYGITSLGVGAFANCLNLKQVAIPRSVKKIGRNCFFNCVSLKRISYSGNKEEWRHIVRGSNWLMKAGTCEVVCLDGPILVDPYR